MVLKPPLFALFAGIGLPLALILVPKTAPIDLPEDVESNAFDNEVLAIAANYKSYGRIDSVARWAPTDCGPSRPNRDRGISVPRWSQADNSSAHSRKLYFLYTNSAQQYAHLASSASPSSVRVGTAIVKESWTPRKAVVGADENLSDLVYDDKFVER